MKTYILYYYYLGRGEEIMRGSAPLLQHRKEQLKKESQFQKGLLTIMSENGIKHQIK